MQFSVLLLPGEVGELGYEAQEVISNILLRTVAEDLKYRHKVGRNLIRIPGAGVICLSVLLQQLGVPTEGVGMVMGIGPILGMFLCMANCLGDVVVSTIVARRCGEINMDVYKR